MQKIIIAGQIHESEAVDMSVTVKCFLVEMKVHSMIQKQKAIYEEYGVAYRNIENIYINKKKKERGIIELTFSTQ